MKKSILTLVLASSLLTAALPISAASPDAASSAESAAELTVLKGIADLTPHSEIIAYAEPYLNERGVSVELVATAADSITNEKLEAGEIDFNYFQHEPYLQSENDANGWNLVNAGNIHVEPITAYSDEYESPDDIPDGAVVAIPNDGTNEYRALRILEQAGFISLNGETEYSLSASLADIDAYIRPIEIVEIDSAQIIPTKADYDFFITNTNKVLESGITSNKLFSEGADSPYANIIAVREEDADNAAIRTLVDVLLSDEVQSFIEENYHGAVIPVAGQSSADAASGSESVDVPTDAESAIEAPADANSAIEAPAA